MSKAIGNNKLIFGGVICEKLEATFSTYASEIPLTTHFYKNGPYQELNVPQSKMVKDKLIILFKKMLSGRNPLPRMISTFSKSEQNTFYHPIQDIRSFILMFEGEKSGALNKINIEFAVYSRCRCCDAADCQYVLAGNNMNEVSKYISLLLRDRRHTKNAINITDESIQRMTKS